MLNDVHVPHNVPLDGIFEFFGDYKPDYVVLAGDILNMDPFDHWAKGSARRAREMPEPKPYYDDCNKRFFRPLRRAVGDKCSIVYELGNHDLWSHKAVEAMPEGAGYFEVEHNVEHVDLWVKGNLLVNIGKLHFTHGHVLKGGKHHASAMLNLYRRSIRYGHFHDVQSASYTSPVDVEDRHTARCCGTLEQYNPDFMDSRPHNWVHAFTWGVTMPDGMFWDTTTPLIRGRFHANGKVYK